MRVINISVREIVPDELPLSQGLYLSLRCTEQLLYVGEAENLRKRLKKHLQHSDNRGSARWIWESGTESLHLEIQVLEAQTEVHVRKALEPRI